MALKRIISRDYSIFRDKVKDYYDVVISGGGMVGLSLACALGKSSYLSNKSVLLLEGSTPVPPPSKKYSNRVSAINPSSKKFFHDIGIWRHMESFRVQPVNNIRVWGSYSNLSTEFGMEPGEEMAYIVENNVIIAAAAREIKDISNVDVSYGARVAHVSLMEESAELALEDGRKISCSLLVGADGANSQVRNAMGSKWTSWSYGATAVVGTLQMDSGGVAWQRFLPEGPVALLPLSDGFTSLVWSAPSARAKELLSLTDDDFIDTLNSALTAPPAESPLFQAIEKAVSRRQEQVLPPLASAIEPGSRAAFPLGLGHTGQYVSGRAVLVGDAAHRVHPLAGQGVNLGISDAKTLVSHLKDAAAVGAVFPCPLALADYQAEALRHNIPVMAAIDFLQRLFTSELPLVHTLSSASFLVAENFSPIKQAMRQLASA